MFMEDQGKIQGSRMDQGRSREGSGKIQGRFREGSGKVQGRSMEGSGSNVLNKIYSIPTFVRMKPCPVKGAFQEHLRSIKKNSLELEKFNFKTEEIANSKAALPLLII